MLEAELIKIIGDYDGLVVRSATKVVKYTFLIAIFQDRFNLLCTLSQATPAVIEAAKKMRIIGRAGVGVDNIDIPTATK
jgi:D-3-phosphoglycerate dehydrogenase / 2-oxoglutarate reductase